MTPFRLAEGATLLRYAGDDDAANRAAIAHAAQLRRLEGVLDAVPAATTTLVLHRPAVVLPEPGTLPAPEPAARVVIPLRYDEALEPRLRALHRSAQYRVAFIGFAPGFPYLEGLPPELHRPRLTTPRVRVPAGSVAIAARYCGIYPAELPGGWNVIGRTGLRLFDEGKATPALLAPGDEVTFEEGDAAVEPARTSPPLLLPVRFTAPSLSVRGGPRFGLGHCGVPPGGAMDLPALEEGNARLRISLHAPALEIVLAGSTVELTQDARLCLTGAPIEAALDGRTIARGEPFEAKAGARLRLGRITGGARAYLCVDAGLRGTPYPDVAPAPLVAGEVMLRVLEGPQAERFTAAARSTFLSAAWRVSPDSDRRGLRLIGPPLAHAAEPPEIPPEGIAPGGIQVPGSGQPVVLGPDRPVTGGYPKIATVVPEDLPRLAQLRPGATLRFKPSE